MLDPTRLSDGYTGVLYTALNFRFEIAHKKFF